MKLLKLLSFFYNLIKPILPFIFVGFFANRAGKKSAEKRDLDQELDAIRQEKKRRAKRDSNSISLVTDRLRASARKE